MSASDDPGKLSDKAIGDGIRALSRQHGTPLAQDAELTGLLTRVADAQEIPDSLVCVLAEVLQFLYTTDQSQREK